MGRKSHFRLSTRTPRQRTAFSIPAKHADGETRDSDTPIQLRTGASLPTNVAEHKTREDAVLPLNTSEHDASAIRARLAHATPYQMRFGMEDCNGIPVGAESERHRHITLITADR